uniref:S49 family peptidase n=1 Tax=Ferrovum sp. TaxID=2609467 RepID=UPI002625CC0E
PAVEQILIDIDSPGGSVYGVEELAAQILAARGQKPVVAVANSLAASAAYWIGSAASEFYCTPGGEVGSIGVWQAHEDLSDALKYEGIDVTLISAGKFKVEGNPYEPLTAEATAFLQSRVDDYYNAFVAAVAQARAVNTDEVSNGMGQGRVLGASAALTLNMIDGIMTFDQVVSLMQSRTKPKASRLSQARNSLALM